MIQRNLKQGVFIRENNDNQTKKNQYTFCRLHMSLHNLTTYNINLGGIGINRKSSFSQTNKHLVGSIFKLKEKSCGKEKNENKTMIWQNTNNFEGICSSSGFIRKVVCTINYSCEQKFKNLFYSCLPNRPPPSQFNATVRLQSVQYFLNRNRITFFCC